MIKQPIPLTPQEVRILAQCPLHYHFARQKPAWPNTWLEEASPESRVEQLVREVIQELHAAGGPARMTLQDCLTRTANLPAARQMITTYYQRLQQDWARVMAGNEAMSLRIVIAGVSLALSGTVDRLDRTRDGGILALLFRMEAGAPPTAEELRQNPAMTIYHALVAATYPLRRPVRLQELWLQANQEVTIELSEEEYRDNLSLLREPVLGLARGEVMARPGSYCDICPFKYRGCPVYVHETPDESQGDDFEPPDSDGKIPPRQWIFKI